MCVCLFVCLFVCLCVRETDRQKCFGFSAVRIYGVSVVYFLFTHLLGKPRYLGDVYLYLCTEITEVSVTVCVIVMQSVFMRDDNVKSGAVK